MGSWLSSKKNINSKLGMEIAQDFLQRTKDLYARIEIAGSLRRKESFVHDIDFAVIPAGHNFSSWERELKNRVAEIDGSVISVGDTICNLRYRDVQVNLFVCADEKYWGVLYMWATGPKGHTIGMNIKAEKKGLHMSPKGIYTTESIPTLIPTPTEADVGKVLDWKYKPPELRGKDSREIEKNMFY